jgi:TusE/DsrC/DsvC family sulfur relay protein
MTTTISNISFNEEGYMTNPSQWSREVALEIAQKEGLSEITPSHWKIIDFCRKSVNNSGPCPSIRVVTNGTGISTREVFKHFPNGPTKKISRIAGLQKPDACV